MYSTGVILFFIAFGLPLVLIRFVRMWMDRSIEDMIDDEPLDDEIDENARRNGTN